MSGVQSKFPPTVQTQGRFGEPWILSSRITIMVHGSNNGIHKFACIIKGSDICAIGQGENPKRFVYLRNPAFISKFGINNNQNGWRL